MKVSENDKKLVRFEYHNNGQLTKTIRENGVETFEWDNLALIGRNDTKYINEPHPGGGNPVLAINGESTEVIFNDILGTSLGKIDEEGYSAITKTSFGAESNNANSFFTGKPYVGNLGYAFLFRNYRADMGKWLSQDLIGYPDGWNNFAYCRNSVINLIDILGCKIFNFSKTVYTSFEGSSNYNIIIAHGWEPIGASEYKGMPLDQRNSGPLDLGNPMDVRTLMSEIGKMGGYDPNLPILLAVCYGGLNFADQLAEATDNKVLASDKKVLIQRDLQGNGKLLQKEDFKIHE